MPTIEYELNSGSKSHICFIILEVFFLFGELNSDSKSHICLNIIENIKCSEFISCALAHAFI